MTPHEEYASRLKTRLAVEAGLARRHILIGNIRLACAVAAGLFVWRGEWIWLLAAAVAFFALIVYHEAVVRRRTRARRASRFYELGLARLEDRWSGLGESGERFINPEHTYAADLDLFGKGSLFELISIARTRAGEFTLAKWLLEPAGAEVVRARQAAVEELRPRLDLREDLSVLGSDVRVGVHPKRLVHWAAGPAVLRDKWIPFAAIVLAALAMTTAAIWMFYGQRVYFLVVFLVEILFLYSIRHQLERSINAAEHAADDLKLLAEIMARLEKEKFVSPRLVEMRAELETNGHTPSSRIRELARWMDMLESRRNPVMAVLNPLVMWVPQVAIQVENWRERYGGMVKPWLIAVGEMEALGSFAGYAYEHPADPFPEILTEAAARIEASAMAHPLIPSSKVVSNDLSLDGVLVISGSNMSGKSTMLRAVGTNVVLALAGAPVRAVSMRLTPVRIGASIRINDSLQAGNSRFYAEIMRVRQIVDLTTREMPVLFLLDELLHGTNSHDRAIGGEGVVKALLETGAIGMVTTHDLTLARIGDSLAPRARNVHFEDHLEAGKMMFDYKMRPGVVTKSNALELMRSVGLKV